MVVTEESIRDESEKREEEIEKLANGSGRGVDKSGNVTESKEIGATSNNFKTTEKSQSFNDTPKGKKFKGLMHGMIEDGLKKKLDLQDFKYGVCFI